VLIQPLPKAPTLPQIGVQQISTVVLPEIPPQTADLVRRTQTPTDTTIPADNLVSSDGKVAAHSVKRLQGGPGVGFPDVRDFYSAAAIREGQSGVAAVRVCVDAKGHLTSSPVIAVSSGYPMLDTDALAVAKAGSGHYRSTTEDGVAINDCYAYRVRFELH
jgi:TonB family protein